MLTTDSTELATRVAVFAKPDDIRQLADLLVAELGLHPTDAMHEARLAPSVMSPRLTSANAELVAGEIERLGLHAEAVSLHELRAFDDLRTTHHVVCGDAGLEVLDLTGATAEVIPWDDIDVISVGETAEGRAYRQQMEKLTVLSTARPLHDVVTQVPTQTLELWIVCHEPERVYRLDARRLNFEALGDRKTNSMRLNLRALLQDMMDHAPATYFTPATHEFLRHDKPDHFETSEGLQNVTQIHLLIARRLKSSPQFAQ